MARLVDVQDEECRAAIAAADAAIDDGEYADSVRRSAAVYLKLIDGRPDLIPKPPEMGTLTTQIAGRAPVGIRGWPDLVGVSLRPGSAGPAEMEFHKADFTMSEALTCVEYLIDMAVYAESTA